MDSMRSLNSFGVAGILKKNCEIFYTNDLRARNMGRVSDLISAKLRDTDADELRVRALLFYGIFETYASRGLPNHHLEEVPPASVEIGIDDEYIAVSISFHWNADYEPAWNGLAARVTRGKAVDPFEKILEWTNLHSTQVIVRYESEERRIEIVSLLSRADAELKDPIEVVCVNSGDSPLLEVANYVELGDLNFSKLLRNPVITDADTQVVAGGESATIPDNIVIKEAVVNADAAAQAAAEEYQSIISELENKVHDLKVQLEAAENASSERTFHVENEIGDVTAVTVRGNSPGSNENDVSLKVELVHDGETVADHGDEPPSERMPLDALPENPESVELAPPTAAETAANEALKALEELAKASKSPAVLNTLREIEEEGEPTRAKRWVATLSSELLLERGRLSELQVTLTRQMRQRESEFKNAERSLKEELKRKDDLLRQRQASLESKMYQITQLNAAVERASHATNDKEQQQNKAKLERSTRLAQMKDEEAKVLTAKVRDLENRLIISQAKSQKGNDLQLTAKVATLEKKADDYKRINQRLMDTLNSQKDKPNDKELSDLRRKVEQLDRQSVESKRSLDKALFKLREAQESEKKFQSDLARAIEENRSLRKSLGNKGSGESGGQAA